MPSLPEPPRGLLTHGNRHDHFELESVREVPDSHAWPALHDHPTAADEPVPVVDLSAPGALERLAAACEAWGAFQVVGHGVSPALLDRVEAASRRLFALPMDRKLRAARPAGGVSGFGLARISCFFSKLMWYEGFTVAGSPLDHARKLWPGDEDPSRFCAVVDEYMEEMKRLAGRLLRLMLLSLGLADEEIKWAAGPAEEARELSSVLQLNSYPACPDPDRAMGLAAHTDSSLVTILHQSNTSGLQLLRAGDQRGPARWVTVPPLPGALVVNVGDLLQILTNGRFKSVVHRAVVNRDRHRLSAAYICGPPAHVRLSPAAKLVAPGSPPAYRDVTWAEYLGLKAKLFDKALSAITVSQI